MRRGPLMVLGGGPARLTCDYNAISVQLQPQLPSGTELGNDKMSVC